jgi:hypothetical protein
MPRPGDATAQRPLAHIVDLDNNWRQYQFGRNRRSPARRAALARMVQVAGTRNRKPSALLFRIAAPRRRSARPPVDLDVLDTHLGYFVRRFQVWIFQDFIRELASIDIRPAEFSALVVVGANRGLSQAELAASLGIERARLARLCTGCKRAASSSACHLPPTAAVMLCSSPRRAGPHSRAPRR